MVEQAYERQYAGDLVAVEAAGSDAGDVVGGGGEPLVATGNHPFWVAAGEDLAGRPLPEELGEAEARGPPGTAAGRWVEARDLRVGDVLVRGDGTRTSLTGLRTWEEAAPVYNLRVADTSTYAAGRLVLAVHSTNCPRPPIRGHAAAEPVAHARWHAPAAAGRLLERVGRPVDAPPEALGVAALDLDGIMPTT